MRKYLLADRLIFMISLLVLLINNPLAVLSAPKHIRVLAELNVEETKEVKLSNGQTVKLKLINADEIRDKLRNAVRTALLKISVDGQETTLSAGNYNLPVTIGKVQIDCPAVDNHFISSSKDKAPIAGKALFRLWPKGSPYLQPGTFVFPIKQEWLASFSQASNEPTYVDWGEDPAGKKIYYHAGFDMGGAEGMDEIIAATDGIVVSLNKEKLKGYEDLPADARPDVVYVVNDLGWYFRYSHLDSVDPALKLGGRVKMGQKVGMIGKQGHSGGWVHLHFEISNKEGVTGKWITEDAYPYAWEAFVRQYKPALIAIARPHQLVWTGEEITLDGRKSKSFNGTIRSYEWTFSDGTKATGAVQKRSYQLPGEYNEMLKVTDSNGNVDYDFTVVQVHDPKAADQTIPVLHMAFHPSLNIKAGNPVTFLVRTFNTESGNETWNFGDGSPVVQVKSETPDKIEYTKGKFAETVHAFAKPGHYIVSVERSNEKGYKAMGRLHVVVNK
jgi:murein DD-endopeptidase MepM/ murein hydrolase activator NlpD